MINMMYNYNVSCKYNLKISEQLFSGNFSSVCFGTLFSMLQKNNETFKSSDFYSGEISVKVATNEYGRVNNKLILSLEELDFFIDEIINNNLFKKSNVSYEFIDENFIQYNILLNNVNQIYIKTLLTFIRYLFEQPYNIILKCVFLLKNYEEFNHLDFYEKFSSLSNIISHGNGHSVTHYKIKMINESEFMEIFNKNIESGNSVNETFGPYLKRGNIKQLYASNFKDIDDENIIPNEGIILLREYLKEYEQKN